MKKLFYTLLSACLLASTAVSCNKPEEQSTPQDTTTSIKSTVLTLESAAAGSYNLSCEIANPVAGGVFTAELENQVDWITDFSVAGTSIRVTVTENLSEAKEVNVKLSYTGAKDVTAKIVQPQWAYDDFEIQMSDLNPFGAKFTITRKESYTGGYFFETIPVSYLNKKLEGETAKLGEFAYANNLYLADVDYLKGLAKQHGHSSLSELFGMLPRMGLYNSDATSEITYSDLTVDTDYAFILYGMEANDEATRKTPVCVFLFHTAFIVNSNLTFTGESKNVSETYANITITPSNNSEYWYYKMVSEIDLQKTTLASVMQSGINSAKSLLTYLDVSDILAKGPETFQESELMPGTKYSVVAWGMTKDMSSTTEPVVVLEFTTKEYEIIDNCTFQIEVTNVKAMDIQVKVTPSNQDTRYYVAFVEKSKMEGYNPNQAAQRLINMEAKRISNHEYDVENLSWSNLPGLLPGIRTIWGRQDEGWTFQARHKYIVYVFGIDSYGIRSTIVETLEVETAEPGASDNSFDVKFDRNFWTGIDFTVTPTIEEDWWLTFLAEKSEIETYLRNPDGTLKEAELFEWIEEYYEDEINQRAKRGTKSLHEHVVPDTDYILFVFGYEGSYTTSMYEFEFHSPKPPLGKSTADFSYTFELFRGEDLSAIDPVLYPLVDFEGDCIMVVRFQVTDNAKHWYFGCWPPLENYADQGGQYYLMTIDMDPNVPGSAMQDRKFFRNRPWWYGSGSGSADRKDPWTDSKGVSMDYYPWTLSGWAEDEEGNYGPWHYDYMIPIPRPKEEVTGKFEYGYTQAYDFWSAPAAAGPMQVYSVSRGEEIPMPFKTAKFNQ